MPSARRWPVRLKRRFSSLAARLASSSRGAGDAAGDRPRRRGRRARARGRSAPSTLHRAAADGGERVPAQRVVDDARERAGGVLAGDAHAPQRDAGEVVDGAVERVDDPAQAGRPLAVGGALLAEDAVVGAAARRARRRSRPPRRGRRPRRGRSGPAWRRARAAGGRSGRSARRPRRAPPPWRRRGRRGARRSCPWMIRSVVHAVDFTTARAALLPGVHRPVTASASGAATAGSVAVRNGRIPRAR